MTTSTPTPTDSHDIDRSTAQTEVLPDNLTQTAVLPDPAPQPQAAEAPTVQAPTVQAPTVQASAAQAPTVQVPAAQVPEAAPAASIATPAQPGYGYPATAGAPFAYPPVRPTNVLGIITLVLGVLGFALVPVITGHIALAQIKRTGDEGRGITIAGLVLGYVGLVGYVLAGLFFFGILFVSALAGIASY
jgi:hypothetical protein